MAEPSAARDKLPPKGVPAAVGEGLAADGQPILEVPPLVEFGDAFETAAGEPAAVVQTASPILPEGNAAPPEPIQRPSRRSFLAAAPDAAAARPMPDMPPARPAGLRPVAAAERPIPVR